MSKIARAVVVGVSVLFSFLIAEGIVRVVAPQAVTVPWQDEINGITCPRPSVRGRHAIPHTFDVGVTFNSQRFRSRKEFQVEPSPRVVRIATLGDSFTFGYGVQDEETYPAQLELILCNSLGPGRAEVINAGNGGTGPAEEALWYDIWVKRFHPHIVILTVVSNDVDDDLSRGLFLLHEEGTASPRPTQQLSDADRRLRWARQLVNALPGYAFVAQHSQLVGLLRWVATVGIGRSRRERFAHGENVGAGEASADRFYKEGLALLEGEVVWLESRTEKSGARLVVVFVPSRESIYPSQKPWAIKIQRDSPQIVGALQRVCSRQGIPFKDLTSDLRERASRARQPLYYDGLDTHPNPLGYRFIAETIARFLIEEGVVARSKPIRDPSAAQVNGVTAACRARYRQGYGDELSRQREGLLYRARPFVSGFVKSKTNAGA